MVAAALLWCATATAASHSSSGWFLLARCRVRQTVQTPSVHVFSDSPESRYILATHSNHNLLVALGRYFQLLRRTYLYCYTLHPPPFTTRIISCPRLGHACVKSYTLRWGKQAYCVVDVLRLSFILQGITAVALAVVLLGRSNVRRQG